jgi:hypothetical protein
MADLSPTNGWVKRMTRGRIRADFGEFENAAPKKLTLAQGRVPVQHAKAAGGSEVVGRFVTFHGNIVHVRPHRESHRIISRFSAQEDQNGRVAEAQGAVAGG